MSDYRAIAGVSETFRTLLRDRMELPPGLTRDGLLISMGTPTAPANQSDNTPVAEDSRINLFLYQVQEHPQLKNQDLPGSANGLAYGKPPLSLNLNLMLTAYGSEVDGDNWLNETRGQLLLGSAMRVLHDYPIITPQLQTVHRPYGQAILHESLRSAYEHIKLSLDPITLEDLTKVWTALTIPYRLSVAYAISVVQIESQATRSYPRLVGTPPSGGPGIVAVPMERPAIEALHIRQAGEPLDVERPFPYGRLGDTLIIIGRNFNRAIEIDMNGIIIPIKPVSNTQIEVEIPDATLGSDVIPPEFRLQPGAQPVEVLSAIEGVDNFRMRSNRALFMLVPLISNITTDGTGAVHIQGRRLILADSNMQTLIGNTLFNSSAYKTASPTQISITVPDVLPNRSVDFFIGKQITNLSGLDSTPELNVRIGTDGFHRLALAYAPKTLDTVAVELEKAIRGAPTENIAFKRAHVAVIENRLLIVPGGLQGEITIHQVGGNAANILKLRTGINQENGYISGLMTPFPRLTSLTPTIQVLMGGATFDAVLGDMPTDIQEAATLLQSAIQSGPTAAFINTKVVPIDNQLLILGGNDIPIIFGPSSGGDETTISELNLRRYYEVRVRVNGAESLGPINQVELPA